MSIEELLTPIVTNLDRRPPKSLKRKTEATSSSPPKKQKTSNRRRNRQDTMRQSSDRAIAASFTAAAEVTPVDKTSDKFNKPERPAATRRTSSRLAPKNSSVDAATPVPTKEQSKEPEDDEDDEDELLRSAIHRTNPVQGERTTSGLSKPLLQRYNGNAGSNGRPVTPSAMVPSGNAPAPHSLNGSTQPAQDMKLTQTAEAAETSSSATQSQSETTESQATISPVPEPVNTATEPAVTFFARIQTSRGPVELQFPATLFTGNMAVFEAYRRFKEEYEEDTELGYANFERIMRTMSK